MPITAEFIKNISLETQKLPDNQRISVAYHQFFSGYYNHMYDTHHELIRFGEKGNKFPIGYSSRQTDGSEFYASIEKADNFQSDCVVAPVWFAPPLWRSKGAIEEMANTFTKSKRAEYGEDVLTKRFLAVYPYAELRQDDNSPLYLRSYCHNGYTAREAVTAQILADTTRAAGVTEQIFLEPHSEKAVRFFNEKDTLCLTAAPLFADWLIENKLITENSALVALDLGAAQKNVHLAQVIEKKTGWKLRVVILEKKRSGHSEVGAQDFLLGNLDGVDTAVLFDDMVASAGSILKTANSLRALKVQVIPCLTHGILCGKYVENITGAMDMGVVPRFAITNSLPQAHRADYLPINHLDVLPVQHELAFFAREVALRGVTAVKKTHTLKILC